MIRPDDHPLGLAAFRPIEGLVAAFPWKDLGDSIETAKPMPFWMREL